MKNLFKKKHKHKHTHKVKCSLSFNIKNALKWFAKEHLGISGARSASIVYGLAAMLLLAMFIIWHVGKANKQNEMLAIISLIVTLFILFISTITQISQKESHNILDMSNPGQDWLVRGIKNQFEILERYWSYNKTELGLTHLHLFMSTPAFGIVGGHQFIQKYRQFLDTWFRVNTEKSHLTVLNLYMWNMKDHSATFSTASDLWVWKDDDERAMVVEQLIALAGLYKRINECMQDNSTSFRVNLYEVKKDELRIIVFESLTGHINSSPGRVIALTYGPILAETKEISENVYGFIHVDPNGKRLNDAKKFIEQLTLYREAKESTSIKKLLSQPEKSFPEWFKLEPHEKKLFQLKLTEDGSEL